MATYIMLSTLTDEGAKKIRRRPERIKEVNAEIENLGVKVVAQYATLGQYDFVNIVEAPDNISVARVSAELASRGSVKLITLPAIDIDELVNAFG
ncbi:MAG: GYD domain-containing protein [Anaerolineales bacterium]|nr:GYD domain-containing protein [Anaerolineales bacterium]